MPKNKTQRARSLDDRERVFNYIKINGTTIGGIGTHARNFTALGLSTAKIGAAVRFLRDANRVYVGPDAKLHVTALGAFAPSASPPSAKRTPIIQQIILGWMKQRSAAGQYTAGTVALGTMRNAVHVQTALNAMARAGTLTKRGRGAHACFALAAVAAEDKTGPLATGARIHEEAAAQMRQYAAPPADNTSRPPIDGGDWKNDPAGFDGFAVRYCGGNAAVDVLEQFAPAEPPTPAVDIQVDRDTVNAAVVALLKRGVALHEHVERPQDTAHHLEEALHQMHAAERTMIGEGLTGEVGKDVREAIGSVVDALTTIKAKAAKAQQQPADFAPTAKLKLTPRMAALRETLDNDGASDLAADFFDRALGLPDTGATWADTYTALAKIIREAMV